MRQNKFEIAMIPDHRFSGGLVTRLGRQLIPHFKRCSSDKFLFPFHARRSDLPRYMVYSKGRLVEDTLDLSGFSWEDRVSFYIGCSFTFEEALGSIGVEIRNVTEGKNVSMFKSNVTLHKVGEFACEMFVTMRPVHLDLLEKAVTVTAQFPDTHGAPIHIGDPARIGIADLARPDRGSAVEVKEGEVPVFWACGVSAVGAIESASGWCVRPT